ncbi:NTP transferase domain-containing protein [Tenggerimyces flavus]|uniref:Probable molybdenum cofactor guanylyltransferase n=1 Tax=Tenggerimyces flavus TaxID=1708749 RepID=A0ABV7YFJ0_9ACTN|nr:NTP transferase domain-containing protein [Tenggerimyces flavus]MBM7784574.1 molybdopterin-guanine dinucleotide biosynthesis protein A [Tenggerimyces flavus]
MGISYDLVVLAGGGSRRMGGTDKVLLEVAGESMLDRVLAAGAGARVRVVVGPRRPVSHEGVPVSNRSTEGVPDSKRVGAVRWAREEPPGSGPLAGVAAGVAALGLSGAEVVVVLAGDMPLLDPETVNALVAAAPAVLADQAGQPQPLAAAYPRAALLAALTELGDPTGRPVRLLLDLLRPTLVPAPIQAQDADTPEDLARIRRAAGHHRGMLLDDWTAQLCADLGIEGLDVDVHGLLDLARDAAHSVDRPAAPLTTFLVGYAAALRGGGADQVAECSRIASEAASHWSPSAAD